MASDTSTPNTKVQLGFSIPLPADDASEPDHPIGHQSPHWSEWDGGKIGGRPSWLNPRDLPSEAPLRCRGPCRRSTSCTSSTSSTSSTSGAVSTTDGSKDTSKTMEGTPLRFIAQLYCPADDATSNPAAFHRSLYVFACPECCSSSSYSKWKQSMEDISKSKDPSGESAAMPNFSDCIRVLRCQLPKQNDFYPPVGIEDERTDVDEEWTKHTSEYWSQQNNKDNLNLCAVCGQRSKGKCPKQQLWFCGPNHQKEHLRASKRRGDGGSGEMPLKYLPSLCYETELVVEEEPETTIEDAENNKTSANASGGSKMKEQSTLFPSGSITDADADLEQKDLNALTNTTLSEAAAGVTDPTTLAFYARMAMGGKENDVRDQCLRYHRWPSNEREQNQHTDEEEVGPLWLSSENHPQSQSELDKSSFPPPCQYCGAPRNFEFQILPQMLHYLLHDSASSEGHGHDNESNGKPREALTEAQRAVLLEAKSKIESGVDLPEGFREQHELAVKNAREALLGISSSKGEEGKEGMEGVKDGLDWGTIAVYTCTASCGNGEMDPVEALQNRLHLGAYYEEVAWVQPPLD